MNILLATNNQHKAGELAAILGDFKALTIITLRDLPSAPREPVEDGDSLEANAYIKAREIFDATGIPTIADDTGLEVDALDGAPGVYSARYAGPNATYEDNCRKLLSEMRDVPDENRTARFRTVICYTDGTVTQFAEGIVEGKILTEMRGNGGFGYDPLFQAQGSEQSFAEMSPEEKNQISHRARAVEKLRRILAPYLTDITSSSDE